MRTIAKVGAVVAAFVFAGSAANALPSLALSPLGGGQYLILLTVGSEGLASLQWDVTSDSGVPDTSASLAVGFSVPSSDATCGTIIGGCNFSATGPFANPANPTGLNGFAVFITSPAQALQGPPAGQPFTVGLMTFSNAGGEGNVSIPASSLQGTDKDGNVINFPVPEPAVASMLGLGLLGLALAGRRSRR